MLMSTEIQKITLPKLRFPEFSEEEGWIEKKLSDLLDYERPDNYIVSDTNYHKTGTPVLTANKSFILGYTNEKNGIYINLPAIIFDDFTVDKKYVDFPFKIKSSAIKILKSKGANNLRFAFELMSQLKYDAKEHKRYYISVYQNILVPVPNPTEQQKIANCLSSLDDLITAENQKLEALKAHKKWLMQHLFPAEMETVPKLRFGQFKESTDWKQNDLGEKGIAFFVNEKIPIKEVHLKNYVSTENLLPNYSGRVTSSKLPTTGSVTRYKKQDILLSNIRPYLKKVWFADIDGGASNDIIVIRAEEALEATFLSYLLRNDDFINYIMKSAEGVKMPRGDKDQIKKYRIIFPKKNEQKKIAECLTSLDAVITSQNNKLKILKLHKKGLMQVLFPEINIK
jgi:type I restriction enzyme S subunit